MIIFVGVKKSVFLKKINNIHDKFFKTIFSFREEAEDFVKHTFPKRLVECLDFSTFKNETETYIDNELGESMSDLMYSCTYNGLVSIKIVLLFEHKSYVEQYPHFQVLRYLLNVWENAAKQKQRPPFVVPILFYHGKQKWKYQKFTSYFEHIDKQLKRFLPNFDFLFININELGDTQIQKIFEMQTLRSALLVMKHIFEKQTFWVHFEKILKQNTEMISTEHGTAMFKTFTIYISNYLNIEPMELVEKIRKFSPEYYQNMMLMEDKTYLRGRQEGWQEGR